MAQIFNRKIQAILNEVKDVMRNAMMESGITQESLADETETTQPSIHRWFSYDLSHFPPVYILALLPKCIAVPIISYFLDRFGMIAIDCPENLKVDGRMEDDILDVEVITAEIIKVKDINPERAIRFCDQLLLKVFTLKKEAQEIAATKK